MECRYLLSIVLGFGLELSLEFNRESGERDHPAIRAVSAEWYILLK
jgi:hypothetical protein